MGADRRGFFISFEGADGVGKSTQIRRLAERLRAAGMTVCTTREPGGSEGAEAIRALLLTGAVERWNPLSEALMMSAARADHLDRLIRPALARGEVVICDRFADSTMAYQGIAGGLGEAAVATLNGLTVDSDGPELTIILDAPIDIASGRAEGRSAPERRFESKGAAYQKKVREAFLKIARDNPHRCVLIDGSADEDRVAEAVAAVVEKALQSRDVGKA
jgi:dTMP kinase